MIARVDRTGTVERLRVVLDEVVQAPGTQSVLLLAADGNGWTPAAVDGVVQAVPVPLFGGVFPELLYGREQLRRGFIVAGLTDRAEVQVIPRLSDPGADYERLIDDERVRPDTRTMLVFVDGLARRVSALVEALFNVFGLQFNYIGGGAGSLSFERKPCLFTNGGLVQDAAVLATLATSSGVGVSHGWTNVAGPFQVTESDRNVIQSLDWRPALDVYGAVVEAHSGRPLLVEDFFEHAKSYPFGIIKLGSETVVRDPLMVDGAGGLVCVGEVPQGTYVRVLTGDVHSLVDAAGRALLLGTESYPGEAGPRTTLFIDCISRALFLGEQFGRELEAVYRPDTTLLGALTLGEIANSRRDYLEFYNKTSVVGVLDA